MIEVLKNISRKTKAHNSIISHKNREICPIFIEIIAYTFEKKKKKIAHLKILALNKVHMLAVNFKFIDFRPNNSGHWGKKRQKKTCF